MAESHSITSELWMNIPGFPGYQVSDRGRVRSYWKPRYGYGGPRLYLAVNPRMIPLGHSARGYVVVVIRDENQVYRTCQVHRLVLSAFVGPAPEGYLGCHRDGSRDNNTPENLYWGSPHENCMDTLRHGRHRAARLTMGQIEDALELRRQGWSVTDLAAKYGVPIASISKRLQTLGAAKAHNWVGEDERFRMSIYSALGFDPMAISRHFGRSPVTVRRALRLPKAWTWAFTRRRGPFSREEFDAIACGWIDGDSLDDLAAKFNSTPGSIRQIVYNRFGTTNRSKLATA